MDIPGYTGNLAWLGARTILLTRHGSHAYGLATPASDVDHKGVAIPPRAYLLGFARHFEQASVAEPDTVVFDLRKFIQMAADANPNVLEMLFTDPSDHLGVTPLGEALLAARGMFVSRKVRHTFTGYAMAQLRRLEAHHRWLVDPPAGPPEPSPEDTYPARVKVWEQYVAWQKSRNPKRAELEARYGYDTKFAAHVVRLMRMCREILTTGQVIVRRPDRDELLGIRHGQWTFERLVAFAADEDAAMEGLSNASALPHGPDRTALDALCVRLVDEGLRTLPE